MTPVGDHSPAQFSDFFNWPTGFHLQTLPAIAGRWDHWSLTCLRPEQAAGPSGQSGEDLLEKRPLQNTYPRLRSSPPGCYCWCAETVCFRHSPIKDLSSDFNSKQVYRKRECRSAVAPKVYVALGSGSERTGVWVSNKSYAADCHWVHCFGGRRKKPTQNLCCVVGNLLLTPLDRDSYGAADQLDNHRSKKGIAEITPIARRDSQTGSWPHTHKKSWVVPVFTGCSKLTTAALWESWWLPKPSPTLLATLGFL